MKKLVLMAVAIVAVSFASCGGNKAANAEATTAQLLLLTALLLILPQLPNKYGSHRAQERIESLTCASTQTFFMRECHQITLLQMTDILTRQNQTGT